MKSIRLAYVVCLLMGGVTVGVFQNCGKGFDQNQNLLSSSSSGINPNAISNADPKIETAAQVTYGHFNLLANYTALAAGVTPSNQGVLANAYKTKVAPGLGKARMVRGVSSTEVYITAFNLLPNLTYQAHVHLNSCASIGGHYKHDLAGPSDSTNEIWMTVATDADGVGTARTQVNYVPDNTASAVVIHNQDGTKFYCADLTDFNSPPVTLYSGKFSILSGASTTNLGATFDGQVTKTILSNGLTGFHVSATGLIANKAYPVHVHAQACSNGSGGGHFQIDPTAATGQANEAWLPLNPVTAGGSASNDIWVTQVPSLQNTATAAMSIVIHDPDTAAKIACADFSTQYQSGTNGVFALLPMAVAADKAVNPEGSSIYLTYTNGNSGMAGMAMPLPSTIVAAALNIKGLASGPYMAHVHALPCAVDAGGHYKIDTTISTASEGNEIWIYNRLFSATAGLVNGGGSIHAETLLRADAMSVVVHNSDSTKLLCADLY